MPFTRFRADRHGSSRYSGRIMPIRIEQTFDYGKPCGGPRQTVSARERDDPALRVERRLAAAHGLELGARDLVARVVAGADERPGFHVLEPERLRGGLHLGELVGVVVAL